MADFAYTSATATSLFITHLNHTNVYILVKVVHLHARRQVDRIRFTKVDGMDILHGKCLVGFIRYIVTLNRYNKGVTVQSMVTGSCLC